MGATFSALAPHGLPGESPALRVFRLSTTKLHNDAQRKIGTWVGDKGRVARNYPLTLLSPGSLSEAPRSTRERQSLSNVYVPGKRPIIGPAPECPCCATETLNVIHRAGDTRGSPSGQPPCRLNGVGDGQSILNEIVRGHCRNGTIPAFITLEPSRRRRWCL